jgi:tungstate transport system permease protein
VTELSAGLLFELTLRTLSVCLPALALAMLFGLPVGIALGRMRFPGRNLVVAAVNSGMGAPPVVVGLVGALLFWRNGPLGALGIMYTPTAMLAVQVAIALPFVVAITLAAVGALDPDWEQQARSLGIPAPRRLWMLLREIRLGVLAAVIAALGGILSEVGAVLMVGGNLEGETRVLTTAILMYTQRGEYEVAGAIAAVLVALLFALSAALTAIQQAGRS